MAVLAVLGGSVAWHADNDPDAAKVLAHYHPDVPNLGDLTTVDWTAVEPVDVVTAGFPCQDLSYAGRGAGIKEGTRSGLWYTIADALGVLRPRLVVLENVAAIVARRPGLDVVLADLARLGFDAEWICVRASDVGAPHRRERWFCVAWPAADTAAQGRGPAWTRLAAGGAAATGRGPAEPGRRDLRAPAADTGGTGLEDRHLQHHGPQLPAVERSGLPALADAEGVGRDEGRTQPTRLVRGPDAALGGAAPADANRGGCAGDGELEPRPEPELQDDADRHGQAATGWGPYAPAIRRWEHILGRPAPAPTEPGRGGQPRLSPAFVEWMQGLPAGHVTAVPGVSRNAQLRILGNGVVPQQATHALCQLLDHLGQRAA